jgi:2-methylisocitrate lyase-like PEP mutase family enzyme
MPTALAASSMLRCVNSATTAASFFRPNWVPCPFTANLPQLAAAGVRRISLATSLYRAAMTGFLDAAREVKDTGQFSFLDRCVTTPEVDRLMGI